VIESRLFPILLSHEARTVLSLSAFQALVELLELLSAENLFGFEDLMWKLETHNSFRHLQEASEEHFQSHQNILVLS
jgi:hypothetical protein